MYLMLPVASGVVDVNAARAFRLEDDRGAITLNTPMILRKRGVRLGNLVVMCL